MTRDQLIETVARALCQEKCAFMGEFPCWDSAYKDAEWPPSACNEPGCMAEATVALTAIEAAGMRVVPVEPSARMMGAGKWNFLADEQLRAIYIAMVLAAQEDSTSE